MEEKKNLFNDIISIPAGCRIKITSSDNWNERVQVRYISGLTTSDVRFFIKFFKIFKKNLYDSYEENENIKRQIYKLVSEGGEISTCWKKEINDDYIHFIFSLIGESNSFYHRKVNTIDVYYVDNDIKLEFPFIEKLEFSNITNEFTIYETEPF